MLRSLLCFALVFCLSYLSATEAKPSESRTLLDIPALDFPFNFGGRGYSFPSMKQSEAFSKDFYQSAHLGLMGIAGKKHRWLGGLAIAGFDVLSTYLPLGNAWVHEEWHRAVLSRRNISSYNDVYHFPIFQNSIAVSHLLDADLIKLKREHPAEQVRLQSAGWEAEYALNHRLEKETFFFNEPGYHTPLLWLNAIGNSAYLFTCAGSGADRETDAQNTRDGADIPKRDFTGLDCTGWVYDLFRPDEPYEARGTHPSGVGINRYRKHSDLSSEEQNYLSLQAYLSLLNILDPQLLHLRSFHGHNPFDQEAIEWNFSLGHMPTSFGSTTNLHFFLKEKSLNLFFVLHSYFNKHSTLPGLNVELLRYPLALFSEAEWISSRIHLWLQPKHQRFDSLASTAGGLFSLQFGHPLSPHWDLYTEIEGKTEGWVAGNPYLDQQLSLRLGLLVSI